MREMRSATRAYCEEQIHRLSWKAKFPKFQAVTDFQTGEERHENPGADALVAALQGVAPTNEQAKRIIDEIQQEFDTCPTPKQLREFALTLGGPKKPVCSVCGGDFWTAAWEHHKRDEIGRRMAARKISQLDFLLLRESVGVNTLSNDFVCEVAVRCGCVAGAA